MATNDVAIQNYSHCRRRSLSCHTCSGGLLWPKRSEVLLHLVCCQPVHSARALSQWGMTGSWLGDGAVPVRSGLLEARV